MNAELNANWSAPPVELQVLKGWLCWRYETPVTGSKPRKVPHYVGGGRRSGEQGSDTDRAKLTTYHQCHEYAALNGFDGVGLAMMPDWGLAALDFDDVVEGARIIFPEVEDIVSQTYAEFSPSGRGVRAFVKGDLGNSKSHRSEGHPYGFEVFSSNGFVTFTGNLLPWTEALGLENVIAPVSQALAELCHSRFPPKSSSSRPAANDDFMAGHEQPVGLTEAEMEDYLSDLDPSMGRERWIRVGMAIHHETAGKGFRLWDDWSKNGLQYPGTDDLLTQWRSFGHGR